MTSSDSQPATDLFVTETMAELSARQGRTGDAIAIYRSLIGGAPPGDERRSRWTARLAALETGGGVASSSAASAGSSPASSAAAPASRDESPHPAPPESPLQLPLVVRQPVRSGQIVYAQGTDLIVLAAVNPGAQLLADGNIHVYAPLRGRAVAGVRGAGDAQIFCLRFEAELVGVDAAYLVSEDLPPALRGQAVRVWLDRDERRCRVEPLSAFDRRAPH